MHQLMNYYIYFDLLLNTNNKTILQLLQARQKKWYGHGRTGRTADYGLVPGASILGGRGARAPQYFAKGAMHQSGPSNN